MASQNFPAEKNPERETRNLVHGSWFSCSRISFGRATVTKKRFTLMESTRKITSIVLIAFTPLCPSGYCLLTKKNLSKDKDDEKRRQKTTLKMMRSEMSFDCRKRGWAIGIGNGFVWEEVSLILYLRNQKTSIIFLRNCNRMLRCWCCVKLPSFNYSIGSCSWELHGKTNGFAW